MRVLGLVPARGGSKGIPGKNIRALHGRPLLAHTADAARAADRLDRVVLSTDDPAIASIGGPLGLEVPFLRPAELGEDDTPMIAVLQHALDKLDTLDDPFGAVCLLQPTSPLRPAGLIDRCIDLLESSGADAVVTMVPVPTAYNPHWVYLQDDDGRMRLSTGEPSPVTRRQDLPPAFHRDGSVYVLRPDAIRSGQAYGTHLEAVVLDPEQTVNLDEPEDWERAEQLLRAGPPV